MIHRAVERLADLAEVGEHDALRALAHHLTLTGGSLSRHSFGTRAALERHLAALDGVR